MIHTQRDSGGKNILSKNWASFLKARLNCSIPGEFPFYFNEIRKEADSSLTRRSINESFVLFPLFLFRTFRFQSTSSSIRMITRSSMPFFLLQWTDWLDLRSAAFHSIPYRKCSVESSKNKQPLHLHGSRSYRLKYRIPGQDFVSMTLSHFPILFSTSFEDILWWTRPSLRTTIGQFSTKEMSCSLDSLSTLRSRTNSSSPFILLQRQLDTSTK